MAPAECDICNRIIEEHLQRRGKRLCFACLTEEVSESGTVPVFNLKNKPVHAACSVCDAQTSGNDLLASPWGFICRHCGSICETQTGVSWDMMKVAAQKEWLLKSNAKIIGPHTSEEVEGLLRDNRIVAHDEVTRPAGRWKLIRDEEYFRLVVNEVRNRAANKKEKSLENTATGTGTMTPAMDEMVRERAFRPEALLEGVEQSLEREAPAIQQPTMSRDLMKTYAAVEDTRITREVSGFFNRRVYVALTILLMASIFVALKLIRPTGEEGGDRNQNFQSLMASGLMAERVGDAPKALAQYQEARMIKPNDPELLLHLAPLTLLHEHQMLQAQRMFQQIIDEEKSANYQKAANVGLGLVSLEAHELDAAKDYFTRARTIDFEYMPAIANLGVVALFKDDLQGAEDLLLKALEKGGTDGAVVITMADLNMAAASRDSAQKAKLFKAHAMLESYLSLTRSYEQEILLVDAKILTLIERPGEATKRIEAFLDCDPEATDLHVRDWTVYRGRASWGLLVDYVKKIASEITPNPRLTAALGLAMYRGREKLEGAQTIEQALSQAPRDPLIMALAGWVGLKLGRRDTAVVNIKEAALSPDKYKLPHILQARLCQDEKNYDCAKYHWGQVLKKDSRSLEALHGLALVAWSMNDKALANTYLTQLYANAPLYIPYLKLSQEMSRGGL